MSEENEPEVAEIDETAPEEMVPEAEAPEEVAPEPDEPEAPTESGSTGNRVRKLSFR